ncbi:hypothetical protein HPY28_19310 [Brevibacillus sp. HB1.2]|uniref:hypothetical protein n=1 Tax=Brevibacillus sp. HB1.2 TaxID=2738807 RepID=UPI00157534D8|nr:hypothetical protein [Brevibacillus sp. HB1.2]NTU22474.1 hypothetical protein [Brevibacillus sp. HB1.2]
MNKEELIREFKRELKGGYPLYLEDRRILYIMNGLLFIRKIECEGGEVQVNIDRVRVILDELANKRIREMKEAIEIQRFLEE